jgi:predicted nucleotidyltransferase
MLRITDTRRSSQGRLPKKSLAEIVRRIVEVAKPETIILFGSAARDQMGPNSDVDLLVIKRGKFDRGLVTEQIYMNMHGAPEAVDVVVISLEDLARYRHAKALVIAPALAEGRVVYAA